jgi:hypothetical protein
MATNPSQGFERTIEPGTRPIPLDFRIEDPKTAIQMALDPLNRIRSTDLYLDSSQLDDQRVGAKIAYKLLSGL